MTATMRVEGKTRSLDDVDFERIDFDALIKEGRPCILKGAVKNAPLVLAGRRSDQDAMSHLMSFASSRPVLNYTASAEAEGRFFYNQQMNSLNFSTEYISLPEFFEKLDGEKTTKAGSAFYVGSAELTEHFPGLLDHDGLQLNGELFEEFVPRIGIWLGNKTTARTHFDMSNNIAACMVGHRRFTLFPPDQIENLYPGPLEPTPGGQVVSMFDMNCPDFERYPRAREALECSEVAELEAGDVLVYPAMWWHQVEALDDFNVMINYWWNPVPPFIDDPMNTLLHGLLSLRDRPDDEKQAWRHLFEFYVFGSSNKARAHLPEHVQGPLAPIDEVAARRLRAKIMKRINR